jgi:hypothetical protein
MFPTSVKLKWRSQRKLGCARATQARAGASGLSRGPVSILLENTLYLASCISPEENDTMALQLRPNCEYCDKDLPPHATDARICSYECTFCADCVDSKLYNVCPNCGGGFAPRPIRPAKEWRSGLSVVKRPPSDKRVHLSYDLTDIAELSQRLKDVLPENR